MRGLKDLSLRQLGILLVALSAAGGAVTSALPAWAAGSDFSTAYQGNPLHDGSQSDSLAPPLTEAWSHAFGHSLSYPVIANGMAFVTEGDNSSNTYGTTVEALNLSSGSVAWSVPLGGSYFWSALTYDNGQVFGVNGSGQLQAFDAATGARTWTTQLPGQYSFSSAPTAANGYVYVGGAGSGGTLYAVSESSGTVAWTASVMNGDDSSPVVTNNGVYVSYACQQTYDFNPITGALIWHYSGPCEGGGGKTPVLNGNQLYVRDSQGDIILNATTGSLIGTFSSGPIPAFSDSKGFFLNGGTLSAESTANQATLWSFTGDGSLDSAPLVSNGVVYEGSGSGEIYALSAATGAVEWSGNAGSGIVGPDEQNVSQPLTGLAIGQGMLLVPTSNGTLVAYTSQTAIAPTAPTALTGTAGNGHATLTWTAPTSDGSSPILGYDVYEGTSPGQESANPVNTSPIAGNSYNVSGLTNDQKYYFTVRALNSSGQGPASSEVQVMPTATDAPEVTAIHPNRGSTSGYKLVLIVGDHFKGMSSVTFGEKKAMAIEISPKLILALSPPMANAGSVDVRVTTGAGESTVSQADRFTYVSHQNLHQG